ncbi:MAG: hypothetical protein EXS14_07955 [Planctomycetes bacterium]|nr:hypothetical protein [Planctomycetota bacterium]
MGRMHDALNKAAAEREQTRADSGAPAGASPVAAVNERAAWRVDERLIAFSAPHDPRCEEFRRLRTALQRMNPQPKVVVFAGINDSEQSALLVANMAATFAEGGAGSVLVLDGDLRAGRLDAMLAARRSPGFAEALGASFDRGAVQPSAVPGVDFLPAGDQNRVQGGSVRSAPTTALFAQAKAGWDLVLVAAPALNASADSEVLGACADGLVLVIEVGRDPRQKAEQAIERLTRSGVSVLGAVSVNSRA